MRRCKFKEWVQGTKSYKEETGWFHQWGCDFTEFISGPGNATLGIIERDDGSIVTISPESITFLDNIGR